MRPLRPRWRLIGLPGGPFGPSWDDAVSARRHIKHEDPPVLSSYIGAWESECEILVFMRSVGPSGWRCSGCYRQCSGCCVQDARAILRMDMS